MLVLIKLSVFWFVCTQIWSQIGQREGRDELDDKINLPVGEISGDVGTRGIISEFITLWP